MRKKHLMRDESAYLFLEAALVYPFVMILFVVFLWLMLLCAQRAQAVSAAENTMVYVKVLVSSGYDIDKFCREDNVPELSELSITPKEYNVYAELWNGVGPKVEKLQKSDAIKKIFKHYMKTTLIASNEPEISTEYNNYIIFSQIDLHVKYTYDVPINFAALGTTDFNKLTISVDLTGVIKDNPETIRNIQYVKYLINTDLVQKGIGNIIDKIGSWFGQKKGKTKSSSKKATPNNGKSNLPTNKETDDKEKSNYTETIDDEDYDDIPEDPRAQEPYASHPWLIEYNKHGDVYYEDEEAQYGNFKMPENPPAVSDDVLDYIDGLNMSDNQKRQLAYAFGSDARVIQTGVNPTYVIRYGNMQDNYAGSWVTVDQYSSIEEAQEALALPGSNQANQITIYEVAPGTMMIEGTVAKNFGHNGGGNQAYVPDTSNLIVKNTGTYEDLKKEE